MRVVALSFTVVVWFVASQAAAESNTYQYDALGRLVSSALTHGSATSSTAIGYDPAGNRSSYQVGMSGGSSPMLVAMAPQSAAADASASAPPSQKLIAKPGIIAPYLPKFKKPSGH